MFTLSSFRRRLYAGGAQELQGETFLEVLRRRFAEPGFSLIDEPEAAVELHRLPRADRAVGRARERRLTGS